MSRTMFLVIWVVFAASILLLMALAWRARKRRHAHLAQPPLGLAGEVIASFAHAGYVSTTALGAPFERLAIPGLSFKGWADVTVRRDGVAIAVTGERPVEIASAQLRGTDAAGGRIGKVVERDGLSLLRWESGGGAEARELESSFRFESPSEQLRFAEAIAAVTTTRTDTNTNTNTHTNTSQENA